MFQRMSMVLFCIILSSHVFAQLNPILNVQSYTLENGLTVFLNEDSTANSVFGAVSVNAGAKDESPNATGMAHYLEHLLFKGTKTLGTTDYEKEKPFLDDINKLYDDLANAKTDEARLAIQKQINEQAVQASKYGLPNEFDKLIKSIGGTGVNAYTNYSQTFYHNSFPSHEIKKWLDLYATRFQDPVFRSFQSELEVVYEEKNRAMDNFERGIFEKMNALLFPDLPYGQWSVLGKVDHLKNPPLSKMYEFFNTNYVANNMALILSGNFDSEEVKPMIDESFGKLKSGSIERVQLKAPKPIEGVQKEKVRITPIKAGFLGFHTPAYEHEDRVAMDIVEYLLSNDDETGYINQIQLNNEMIYCGAFSNYFHETGSFVIFYVPKVLVQSLGNAEKKVHAALDQIRNNQFSEEMFGAAKQKLSQDFQKRLENGVRRGNLIGDAFNRGLTWEEMLSYSDQIMAVDRNQVVAAANKYLGDNYVKMISRTGFPKKPKLEKPPFKPVSTEQIGESKYAKAFNQLPSGEYKPKFLDFENDVERKTIEGDHEIIVSKNPVNDLFYLTMRFRKGILADPGLLHASSFMNSLGAGDYDPAGFKRALASVGGWYNIYSSDNYTTIEIRGADNQLAKTLELINSLVNNPRDIEAAHKTYLNSIKASRKGSERNAQDLGRAVINYGLFGKESRYLTRGSQKELKAVDPHTYVNKFQDVIKNYSAQFVYTGTKTADELESLLQQQLTLSKNAKFEELAVRKEIAPTKNKIIFVPAKKTVQSHIYFYAPGKDVSKENYANHRAFNQYFGGGFSGLVLQEIREYRSLAYSAGASFNASPLPETNGRLLGYIGCQSDKTNNAIKVMHGLITDLPEKPDRIEALRSTLQLQSLTSFPDFKSINQEILDHEIKGRTEDPNRKAYGEYAKIEMKDIVKFHEDNIKGQPMIITIYGDKKRIDLDQLKAIGEVVELKLSDVVEL